MSVIFGTQQVPFITHKYYLWYKMSIIHYTLLVVSSTAYRFDRMLLDEGQGIVNKKKVEIQGSIVPIPTHIPLNFNDII